MQNVDNLYTKEKGIKVTCSHCTHDQATSALLCTLAHVWKCLHED